MPHSHNHGHGTHTHEHPEQSGVEVNSLEVANQDAGQGPVLLDIGDGVGALVLYADPAAAGIEIEISPVGQDAQRTHVAVLARPGPAGTSTAGTVHAAVYPVLAAGRWNLWFPDNSVAMSVDIVDGEVTEAHWVSGPA